MSTENSTDDDCNKNNTNTTSVVFDWPPLESNPKILEDYMECLGLPTDQFGFSELLGMSDDFLSRIPKPVLGVIVNFEPIDPEAERKRGSVDNCELVDYYMKQTETLDNACGLIACLHCIFNHTVLIEQLDPDSILSMYYNKAKDLTPAERATLLEKDQAFQQRHQKFATFGQSDMPTTQKGVKHHYVAYIVNSNQQLIELNGTRLGPRIVMREKCTDVLKGTIKTIQNRLADQEITFSLSILPFHAKN